MVPPEISIDGKNAVLVGHRVKLQANFTKGRITNTTYCWELPNRWSIIDRSDKGDITVQVPRDATAAQGDISLTITDTDSGRQYNKVKTVSIVQEPKIKVSTDVKEISYKWCGYKMLHSKCVDAEISFSAEGWEIFSASVWFSSNGEIIDNGILVRSPSTDGEKYVDVKGDKTLTRNTYILSNNNFYHETSTRGHLFSYQTSPFEYKALLRLRNIENPWIVCYRETSASLFAID